MEKWVTLAKIDHTWGKGPSLGKMRHTWKKVRLHLERLVMPGIMGYIYKIGLPLEKRVTLGTMGLTVGKRVTLWKNDLILEKWVTLGKRG